MLWIGQYAPTSTRSWSVRHASPEYTQPTRTDQLAASARAGHGHNAAPDNLGALELVEQSEATTGSMVEEAMGDAAYGDGGTRQTFAEAGRQLVAKVPGRPNRSHFPKDDFHLDLAAGSCTCPAGQVTRTIVPAGKRTDHTGRTYRLQAFQFDGAVCRVCPLRSQCIAAQGREEAPMGCLWQESSPSAVPDDTDQRQDKTTPDGRLNRAAHKHLQDDELTRLLLATR